MNAEEEPSVLAALAVALAGVLVGAAAQAAPVPVKVNLTNLRCIQNYALAAKDDDQVYLTVTGVAKGADVSQARPRERHAAGQHEEAGRRREDKPVTLWEGELADGEFALLTVTLFHGKGDDAAKAFADAARRARPRASPSGRRRRWPPTTRRRSPTATVKAQQGVVTKVKETLSPREEHRPLRRAVQRARVEQQRQAREAARPGRPDLRRALRQRREDLHEDQVHAQQRERAGRGDGEYFPQVMPPISEDKQTVRVKMLETEYFEGRGPAGRQHAT